MGPWRGIWLWKWRDTYAVDYVTLLLLIVGPRRAVAGLGAGNKLLLLGTDQVHLVVVVLLLVDVEDVVRVVDAEAAFVASGAIPSSG